MSESRPVAGWGGVSMPAVELLSEDLEAITRDVVLSRGLGRSYGDSSLPSRPGERVANTVLGDRLLAFDADTGSLRAEAGLSLHAINRIFLHRRWFVPVSPGTQYVTLGGMVAADVHGKNHHVEGCFGGHVTSLRIRVADGRVLDCGPDANPQLFWATVGGMGLTGHILEVEFKMERIPSPWIWAESQRFDSLTNLVTALRQASTKWPFTVAWVDVLARGKRLGRGILTCGRWADASEAPPEAPQPHKRFAFPLTAPEWATGRLPLRLASSVYYRAHLARRRGGIQHPETFFYPLDAIRQWNRAYGKRGFTQYQCVLPDGDTEHATRRFVERFAQLRGRSFVNVVKDCGAEGRGLLSFPRPGVSFALDIPIRNHTAELVRQLNELVTEAGGRIYMAKDQFTTAMQFDAMEPRLGAWLATKRTWDPEDLIRSAQAVRLGLCSGQSTRHAS